MTETYPRTRGDLQAALGEVQLKMADMCAQAAHTMLQETVDAPTDQQGTSDFWRCSVGPIPYTQWQAEKYEVTKRIGMVAPTEDEQIPIGELTDYFVAGLDTILSIPINDFLTNPLKANLLETVATGRNSQLYHTWLDFKAASGEYMNLILPVGEYGPGFTLGLLKTAARVIRKPATTTHERMERLGADSTAPLQYTYWGRQHASRANRKVRVPGDNPSSGTALEAIKYDGDISILQAVSLLTAERVPGFETGAALWAALRQNKVVEKLTPPASFWRNRYLCL